MAQTHTGGCHCGAVRYEVTAVFDTAVTCNCSICSKSGTMLAFVPSAAFTLLKGEESLTEYRFHKEVIAHLFCNKCGVRSFARGQTPEGDPMVAVNVRCVDDIDLGAIAIMQYDGKAA